MADAAAESEVGRALRRSRRCWEQRSGWDSLYQDAYDYVLPNRRPGGAGKSKSPVMMLFDMTGPTSAMHCAQEIVRQVFPVNTPFVCEAGPLVRATHSEKSVRQLDRDMQKVSEFTYPFFKTGMFDTAMLETATDLTIGTGALLPMRGPSIERPLIFVNVPQDEIAIDVNAWGELNFVSWKRENLGREAIMEAWPKGEFSAEFRKLAKDKPYDEVTLRQDFWMRPDGRWQFAAYCDRDCASFIVKEDYPVQPIAVPRFYRVPGERYGRGPVLFALPSIKTANKAQELTLKAAAIQMLGIWGYRAGGTFNPDTTRVGPAEFWPMMSTGGVLGPDVTRLDPAAGRLDIARLVISGVQSQIRDALLDYRISDDGGTPASASEIAARMSQNAMVHTGAYGRLINELLPVVVFRAMNILHGWGLLGSTFSFNELLVSVSINSPMMIAMKADELRAMTSYYQLAAAVDPQNVQQWVKTDRFLDRSRRIMLVPSDVVPTDAERQQAAEAQKAEQAEALLAEGALKAAPKLVEMAANDGGARAA